MGQHAQRQRVEAATLQRELKLGAKPAAAVAARGRLRTTARRTKNLWSALFLSPAILLIANSTCTPRLLPSNSCHSSTAIILSCWK